MMVRSFVYLFLLLIVFFTGMMFGVNREQSTPEFDYYYNLEMDDSAEETDIVGRELFNNNYEESQTVDADGPSQFTQKTASFLETVVKGFYNVVVEILYQISSLFF